jgi:NADH/NAD ratio-sensing transcriptional regulator Rex
MVAVSDFELLGAFGESMIGFDAEKLLEKIGAHLDMILVNRFMVR